MGSLEAIGIIVLSRSTKEAHCRCSILRLLSVATLIIVAVGFGVGHSTISQFLQPDTYEDTLEAPQTTDKVSRTNKRQLKTLWQEQQEFFYRHHQEHISTLINKSTILNWETRRKAPNAFRPLLEKFFHEQLDGHRISTPKRRGHRTYLMGDICYFAKLTTNDNSNTRPHVLFSTPFGENWGALSTRIPNRTFKGWNLTEEWKRQKCSRQMIVKYLDHHNTLAVIATQFQDLDHPKVHSIPLGLLEKTVPRFLKVLNDNTTHMNSSTGINRPQLLMINSRPRKIRQHVLETAMRSFNGTVQNSYGQGPAALQRYFQELRRSKFVLSPSGLGLDCYRHWEALYFGTIPVLEHFNRTDGWYRTLQDLPVAWIDSYEHLTSEWLEQEYGRLLYLAQTYRYEKLTKQYWIDLIRSYAPSTPSSSK